MFKKYILTIAFVALLAMPAVSHAALVDDLMAQIRSLLQQVTALQQQVLQIQQTQPTTVVTTPVVSNGCPVFTRTLQKGDRGSDVASLQEFLAREGAYAYPVITGYFGTVTEQAVQAWQQNNYVVYGGSAAINGFGVVGAKTQSAIVQKCNGTTSGGDTAIPAQCKVWNDGCNTCTRTSASGQFACTQRACFAAGTPRCEAYFVDIPVTGTTLYATQTAGDAPMGVIFRANVGGFTRYTYELDFGDGSARAQMSCYAPLDTCLSPASVEHTYKRSGAFDAILYQRSAAGEVSVLSTLRITVGAGAAGQCRSHGQLYNEGTHLNCINVDNASYESCIADAYYECSAGEWVINGGSWGPICTLEYAPVCGRLHGVDQTYGNTCQLNAAKATKVYDGVCGAATNNSVSVSVSGSNGFVVGRTIPVSWTTKTTSTQGMYLSLEDAKTGTVIKSVKVDPGTGFTNINTGDYCNAFFSDGLDAGCTTLKNRITQGNTLYRIRAVLYTPATACFGYCAYDADKATTVAESYSSSFYIHY